jgi:peptide deformylase
MRTLKLEYYPESIILVTPAEPVNDFSSPEVFAVLVDEMFKAMKYNLGLGLAAPQIGLSQRIFVAEERDGSLEAFFNPVILDSSKKQTYDIEACLSIPGLTANIKRPIEITLQYQDIRGIYHIRDIDGGLARVVQHEIDHLDGWLFPFYLIPGAVKGEFKPRVWSLYDELTDNSLELYG